MQRQPKKSKGPNRAQLLGSDGLPLAREAPAFKPAPLRSNSNPITERVVDTDDGFRIVRTQECDDVIEGVHHASSATKKDVDGARYLGSVPLIVCEIWSKECGAAPGTREFAEYAKKKIMSGEFAKLRVDRL